MVSHGNFDIVTILMIQRHAQTKTRVEHLVFVDTEPSEFILIRLLVFLLLVSDSLSFFPLQARSRFNDS